jgi:hypothetical protein
VAGSMTSTLAPALSGVNAPKRYAKPACSTTVPDPATADCVHVALSLMRTPACTLIPWAILPMTTPFTIPNRSIQRSRCAKSWTTEAVRLALAPVVIYSWAKGNEGAPVGTKVAAMLNSAPRAWEGPALSFGWHVGVGADSKQPAFFLGLHMRSNAVSFGFGFTYQGYDRDLQEAEAGRIRPNVSRSGTLEEMIC